MTSATIGFVTDAIKRAAGSALILCVCALFAAGFAGSAGPAWGFDESVQAKPESDQSTRLQGIQISPQTSSGSTGMELTVPGDTLGRYAPGGANGGTALPGLGVLPKLDFGLELLYGAPDQGTPVPDQSESPSNALTVHGSLKKTF